MAVVTIKVESEPDPNSYITINLYRAPVWFGDQIVADPALMVMIGSNGYGASYTGELTYSQSGRARGQVHTFEFANEASQSATGGYSGDVLYSFEGLNDGKGLSAEKLYRYAVNGESPDALQYLLSRSDVITGSGFDSYAVDEILYGWGGNDRIFGVDGNDVIGGGAGRDTLAGGNGVDYFYFDSAKNKDADKILDFGFGGVRDQIVLQQAAFANLALGQLADTQFVVGTSAIDADDRIILNRDKLFYDPDGSGAAKAMLIAKVGYAEVVPTGVLQLSASDIHVVASAETIVPYALL